MRRQEPNLDVLRSFAVLCVVGAHLASFIGVPEDWLSYRQGIGIFGVALFFVHTSLVLMMSLERQTHGRAPTARDYAAFLVRRAFRIYPLSMLVVVLAYVWLPKTQPTPQAVIASLLLVHDIARESPPIAPLWSLPAEMQMYLVLPALYWLLFRHGDFTLLKMWLVAVAVAIAAAVVDARIASLRYAPCFVAGVICYEVMGTREREWRRRRRLIVGWELVPLLLVLLAAYVAGYARFGFQAGWAIPVTLLVALALPRFVPIESKAARAMAHRVATYSYGIYLFHVPAMTVSFEMLRLDPVRGSALALALTLGASVAAYHLVERPMIRRGQEVAERLLSGRAEAVAAE